MKVNNTGEEVGVKVVLTYGLVDRFIDALRFPRATVRRILLGSCSPHEPIDLETYAKAQVLIKEWLLMDGLELVVFVSVSGKPPHISDKENEEKR